MPFWRKHSRKNPATGRKENVSVLYLRWPDSAGQWHKARASEHGITDYKSAQAWEAARKAEAAKPQRQHPQQTLAALFAARLEFKAAAGQPTERDAYSATALLQALGESTPPKHITQDAIRAYSATRSESVSAGTVIKELNFLSAAWNWAITQGWPLPPNPVKGNKPKTPAHREVFITQEQAAALIEAAQQAIQAPYLAPAIVLGINCGLRQGELEGLEWQHIGLDTRVIKLPADNDGDEQTRRAKQSKVRWIPYNDAAHAALLELQALRKNDSRWVLCHQWPKKNRKPGDRVKNLKKAFSLARARAGLPEWATIHVVFRHSPATWLYQNGVPIQDIAAFLRQSVLSVTEMYAHLGERKKREIYAEVGNFVPKACPKNLKSGGR